ncbi:hypothetical protein KAR34_13040 [bacterium]|nr:hypothetical protein [bacterium]
MSEKLRTRYIQFFLCQAETAKTTIKTHNLNGNLIKPLVDGKEYVGQQVQSFC